MRTNVATESKIRNTFNLYKFLIFLVFFEWYKVMRSRTPGSFEWMFVLGCGKTTNVKSLTLSSK